MLRKCLSVSYLIRMKFTQMENVKQWKAPYNFRINTLKFYHHQKVYQYGMHLQLNLSNATLTSNLTLFSVLKIILSFFSVLIREFFHPRPNVVEVSNYKLLYVLQRGAFLTPHSKL